MVAAGARHAPTSPSVDVVAVQLNPAALRIRRARRPHERKRHIDITTGKLYDDDIDRAIVTEWKEFRAPDFEAIKAKLKQPVIFDGRNLYDPAIPRKAGMEYFTIGRKP